MADDRAIPIISGPTGSGKSSVALELAKSHPIEIISADSRQVIKYLDIGTAKPTKEEQGAVRTHLIDIIEPGEKYSAVKFMEDAEHLIGEIQSRNCVPVVVGGTGLYLKALTEGLVVIDTDVAPIRKKLERDLKELGHEAMHQKLAEIDPEEGARIHPHNYRHIMRALEIFYQTGKTKSELVASGTYKRSRHSYVHFCLAPSRERLYERINSRVDQMMAEGWLDEMQQLLNQGYGARLRQAEVIGYAELLDYFDGRTDLQTATDLIKQNTRRFAKRQMTWFRGQGVTPFYQTATECLAAIEQYLISGR